jgi:transcriptional regulator with XRE-family HTH domain
MNAELTASALQELNDAVTRSGKNRDQIAVEAHVSLRTLYYLLRGHSKVTVRTLVSVLRVLDVDADAYLSRHLGLNPPRPQTGLAVQPPQPIAGRWALRESRICYNPHRASTPEPCRDAADLTVSDAVTFLAHRFDVEPARIMEALMSVVLSHMPATGKEPKR